MKNYYHEINPQLIRNFVQSIAGSRFLNSIFVLIISLFLTGSFLYGQSPLAANGKLSVSGTQLVNKNGTAIQLRGMSSHGTQWYTEDYNFNSLSVLANKWGIDVFRIAMYPTDKPDATKNAYEGNPAFWKSYVDNLVDICGSLGIYCIIDWHVLNPGDPNDATYLPMAKEFWDYMSKKHAGKAQVLYEICNEPNGITWATVKAYANIIIPIIRANDPNAIIIVGSPTWSSDVDIAATDPIKDPVDATKLAKNVMYTFHFYAASHGQNYRDKITAALAKGLPIFATEWGSTDASGGGTSNWTETQTWMDFLATNKISWTNWSYSDKSETSAVLQPGSGASLLWDNTNAQGDKIKTYIASPADSWTSSGNWSPSAYIATPLNGDYFLPNTTVTLTSTAVDKDGTIASVDFLVDGVKIGTATAAPYSVQWTPTTVKDYVVTTVAKDNAGATGTSVPFTYHVVASINETAYPSGTAWPVPGDIACMNFDNGGEMIAYHDLDGVHKGPAGGSRATEGVDVEGSSNIGYVLTGEWLKYTVNVATSGTYDFTLQTASGLPGTGKFHLESNGVPVTAVTDVPSSGSWGSYQPIVVKGIALNAGTQVIKLYIDCGNFNFSTMNFKFIGGTTYAVTASAGTGGTITPNGKVTLAGGASQTFAIAPSTGNKITDVSVDGVSAGAVASYTFTNINANHTIAATFGPAVAYTVTASAGTGGTITPSGATTVYEGSSQTFAIVPSSGFKVSDVKVDGVSKGALSSYTFTSVAANHTIAATFTALATYTIIASASTGGTITPSGATTVTEGTTQAYSIQATPGYKILDVTVDGVSQGKITSYTFSNISANHSIAVTFDVTTCDLLSLFGAPSTNPLASVNTTYTYVYVLGTHAAITNITKFTINWDLANNGLNQFAINTSNGVPSWYLDLRSNMTWKLNAASPTVTITSSGTGLDGDYYVALDKGNFVMIDKLANYAIYFSNTATAPQTCNQTTNYTITASAGTGGSITPSGAVTVSQGANSAFTITPATGYKINTVTVDGVSQGAISTYTFTAVAANHTISASFTATPTFTITATADTGGSISPSGSVTVAEGASQVFTITASAGYNISKVTVDGVSQGAISTYTFTGIAANHTIAASFVAIPAYTITATAGTGGTISPPGTVTVNKGASQAFAISASTGYTISSVTVDGVSQGAISTYSFANVTANHTIAASFVVQSCNLLTQFGVPRTTALPSIANSAFKYTYVLGAGGPDLSNINSFTINWDLPNKGLWQFSMNTNNGVPSWWLDLLPKITQSFGSTSPACTITGSGITGFDGDYWVTLDGANFVMVSQTGNFAIYASNSATAPATCAAKSAIAVSPDDNVKNTTISLFPSPAEKGSTVSLTLNHVSEAGSLILISDMSGKMIQRMTARESLITIPIDGKFNSGIYNITVIGQSNVSNTKLMVK
jgi:hypothetical protein